MATIHLLDKEKNFSLVLGGPLYQLLIKSRLASAASQLLRRRVLFFVIITWLPLALLSLIEGNAWGSQVRVPFIYDIEMHIRLLLALPLLIISEIVVHKRMAPVVSQFVERGIIQKKDRAKFDAAIDSAMRWRNSIAAEVVLIAFVYIVGVGIVWRSQLALDVSSWHGIADGGQMQLSLAGWWLGLISLPFFQFLLLRWYYRLFIWARFLWQVSRLHLNLTALHPDRCGGLGFLSAMGYAFSPVLFAQGTMLAGLIASRVFFAGAKLPEFKLELAGLVGLMVFVVLGPLLVFAPKLEEERRKGARAYGTLASNYIREFQQKWMMGQSPDKETLVGSADIQSLADLGGSFDVIKEMKVFPFNLRTVIQLSIATLLPVAPLLLTMFSLEELLQRLLSMVL
ncbi:hypothetical protein [Bdellovibrio sp. GT3]|uniref:hypothetical protein n=1 Tax=Bdellovibrio sp. GT3 TaxID=3136282 RepID=UPI0030F2CA1E